MNWRLMGRSGAPAPTPELDAPPAASNRMLARRSPKDGKQPVRHQGSPTVSLLLKQVSPSPSQSQSLSPSPPLPLLLTPVFSPPCGEQFSMPRILQVNTSCNSSSLRKVFCDLGKTASGRVGPRFKRSALGKNRNGTEPFARKATKFARYATRPQDSTISSARHTR